MTLIAGSTREEAFTVDGRLMTDVGGSLAVGVLSTPSMIAMMERNAARLAAEHLDDGYATVGFEVCVRHVAAAGKGTRCLARARLREVLEGRKLRFEVEVVAVDGPDGGERTIGLGTHERRVIETADHARAAAS